MKTELLVGLALDWLRGRYTGDITGVEITGREAGRFAAGFSLGDRHVSLEGGVLFAELLEPGFEARARMFEAEVGKGLKGAFLLWPPPGVEIPTSAAELQPLVAGIRDNAREMAPGEVRDVSVPVTLFLRKTADEGQYITVTGGLSSHWSEMSRYVRGVYQLDSRGIHRLPRDDDFVPAVSRRLGELSQTMQVGEWAELPSADHWSLCRLESGLGFGLVMAPPAFDPGDGTYLRRALRRLVREMGAALAERGGDLRMLLLVTSLESIREENIGPALVGFDPSMYVAIDLFALAADGEVRPILEPPVGSLPWLRPVETAS
jgi:hypothetical protein